LLREIIMDYESSNNHAASVTRKMIKDSNNDIAARICRIETILHVLCEHFDIDPKARKRDEVKIKLCTDATYETHTVGTTLPIQKLLSAVTSLESGTDIKSTRPIIKLVHNGKHIGHLIINTALTDIA